MIQSETGLTVEELERRYAANLTHCFDFSPSHGWLPLVAELLERVTALHPDIEIAQIKSKYASLRFYVNETSDPVHELIDEYEKRSERVCEDCGAPGYPRYPRGRWVVTCCDACAERRAAG